MSGELSVQLRGEGRAGEGMQRSANLPYACWSKRCQPPFCKSPLFVEERACPIQCRLGKGGGQLFSGGALISIVLMQKKLKPIPIEITVHRKSVPKPIGVGLSVNLRPPPTWKTPSNRAAVKEVNEHQMLL